MKQILLTMLAFCGMCSKMEAQELSPVAYIAQYKDMAIEEMRSSGVPAAITLAQGLLETENGNSDLLRRSNNHFGIKCKSNWTGPTTAHDDDALGECFRVYENAAASYRDHSHFLRNNQRYAFLFLLDITDYKGWAHGLKKAGYATNPKYPAILIKHIEQYNLHQYTLAGLNPPADEATQTETVAMPEAPVAIPASYPVNTAIADAPQASMQVAAPASTLLQSSINGLKCVFAPRGSSLLAIASHYQIPLSRLLAYNDLEQDGLLQQGQYVFLEKKSNRGPARQYRTKAGETAYSIAQQHGMQLSAILAYNAGMGSAILPQGSLVNLQEPDKTLAATPKIHEVQPKEALYGIAKKYGVTVDELKAWNTLTSNNLSVGQQLIVGQ
jgi:LysM repeat protein